MLNWDALFASYSSRGATLENASKQSSWQNSETQILRVPKVLTNQLIKLARRLGNGEAIAAEMPSR